MKFLCVCYYDAAAFANFTEEEFKKMGEICAPHDEEFKASGKVRLIGSLALPDQFRTLRADTNSVTVTEVPMSKHRSRLEPSSLSRLMTWTKRSRSRGFIPAHIWAL